MNIQRIFCRNGLGQRCSRFTGKCQTRSRHCSFLLNTGLENFGKILKQSSVILSLIQTVSTFKIIPQPVPEAGSVGQMWQGVTLKSKATNSKWRAPETGIETIELIVTFQPMICTPKLPSAPCQRDLTVLLMYGFLQVPGRTTNQNGAQIFGV
jgi:hypothetical protein